MNCYDRHFAAVGEVLRTDGEVQPEVVELLLDDELVPRAAVDADLHQEGGVLHGLGTVAADEVCGVAAQMVRVLVAAHLVVQLVAAVAAAHADGRVSARGAVALVVALAQVFQCK